MPLKDRLDAETARILQPKDPRFPRRLPQRLERFKVESGLSWAEIARRLGTYPLTIRRWRCKGVRPNLAHQKALLDLADDLGLGHIFTD